MNALGAEQFRVLAGRVVQVREKKGAKILAMTSSLAGEGKTTVALGLAITLARDYLEETILDRRRHPKSRSVDSDGIAG